MKLVINLEDWAFDDNSIADAIRDAVLGTVKSQVQTIVREELKKRHAELRAAVVKRVDKNMQHLAKEALS